MLISDNNNHLKDIFGLAAVEPPREQDTVFGRGGFANRHPGNKEYLRLIEQYEESYMLCQRKYQKVMAVNILHYLRIKVRERLFFFKYLFWVHWEHATNITEIQTISLTQGVRFLKKDEKSGVWCTVNLSQCRQKISQRLRERAPFMKLAKLQKTTTHARKVSIDSTGPASPSGEATTTPSKQPGVLSSHSLRDAATSCASISSSNNAQMLDDINTKEEQVEEAIPSPFSSMGHPQPSSVLSQYSFSLRDFLSDSIQAPAPAGISNNTAASGNEEKKTSLALPFDKVFDIPFCPVESNNETFSLTTTKKRRVECNGVVSEGNDNICQLCPCKRRKIEVEDKAAITPVKRDDDALSCISLEGLAELDDMFDQESSFNLADPLPLPF